MTALSRVRAALSAGERPADADVREVCADAARLDAFNDIPTARLKVKAGVESLDRILAADYELALTWVKRTIADRNKETA